MKKSLYIGIDCGTNTGIAIWCSFAEKFYLLATLKIHEAMQLVLDNKHDLVQVRVEDARQVRFGTDPKKMKGAGSVCRDAKIWEDFLTDHKIPFLMLRPNPAITKWDAIRFNRQTGWQGKSTEHSRDAAMLVVGL